MAEGFLSLNSSRVYTTFQEAVGDLPIRFETPLIFTTEGISLKMNPPKTVRVGLLQN